MVTAVRLSGVKTWGVLGTASLLVLLSGCAEDTPTSRPVAAGSAERDESPDWFDDRPPLPACDMVVLDQGQQVPEAAVACLFAGSAASGAELQVRRPTVEGDPIDTYYRRLPGAPGLDVVTDATRDRFGVDEWRWVACPDAGSLTDLGDCTAQAVKPR